MAYEVPPLPYGYDALAPTIDEETMQLHHDKHHQAYVDKANGALEGTAWDGKPIEEVIANLDALPDDIKGVVRNNGGGHLNHALFWESMSPDGGGEPSGELGDAINSAFGSFDAFKEKFEAAGVGQFGSGWAWLVLDGGLSITTPCVESRRPKRTFCSTRTSVLPASFIRAIESATCFSAFGSSPSEGSSSRTSTGSSISERANSTIRR